MTFPDRRVLGGRRPHSRRGTPVRRPGPPRRRSTTAIPRRLLQTRHLANALPAAGDAHDRGRQLLPRLSGSRDLTGRRNCLWQRPSLCPGPGERRRAHALTENGTLPLRWIFSPEATGPFLMRSVPLARSSRVLRRDGSRNRSSGSPAASCPRRSTGRSGRFPSPLPGPGCYALQIDAPNFTQVIVLMLPLPLVVSLSRHNHEIACVRSDLVAGDACLRPVPPWCPMRAARWPALRRSPALATITARGPGCLECLPPEGGTRGSRPRLGDVGLQSVARTQYPVRSRSSHGGREETGRQRPLAPSWPRSCDAFE